MFPRLSLYIISAVDSINRREIGVSLNTPLDCPCALITTPATNLLTKFANWPESDPRF
jgi:hypothetical protein